MSITLVIVPSLSYGFLVVFDSLYLFGCLYPLAVTVLELNVWFHSGWEIIISKSARNPLYVKMVYRSSLYPNNVQ